MNGFWHLLYLWTIFHFSSSQISHSKYSKRPESPNDPKSELKPNEGTALNFKFGIVRDEAREKWIGPNGQLRTSHAVSLPEATQFIKREAQRIVGEKQETEAVVEQNNTDDWKSAYQDNLHFNSEYKRKSPRFETNHQESPNKLIKISVPFYMATHYLKLFEGHDHFKNELNNPKERAISYGSNDEEKEYSSSDKELRAAPSNSESQIVNPEVRKFPSSNYKVQSQNDYIEAVEKRQQVQPHFNIPSVSVQCSPLNPLLHSLPHSQTDESCEQSLEGWIEDPGCACVYLVAERNDDGCPAKFYALCQRFADKIIRRGNEANSLGSEVSKSSDGQNTEIDSSRQGKQVDDCNQQLENSGKLKRESGKIEESPAEDNKKANQTVVIRLLDQEDESKEFESEEIEAQLTSTNSSSEIFNTQ